jgi:ubiquinone/menaquinone biosynthesis C-methylase UbiE
MNRTIETYRRRLQDPERARKYAQRFERGERKRIDRREQRAVRSIFSGLTDCRTILDVPSGAGRFVGALSENGRKVLEMDAAFEILEFAQDRAFEAQVHAGFAQADASRLPLTGNSVDAVFCNRLLHHLTKQEERAMVLRELHRVTRHYAIVSFFDYRGFGGLRKLLKRLRGRKPIYDGQPTLQQFSTELGQCGFRVRDIIPTGGPWVSQKYCLLEKA